MPNDIALEIARLRTELALANTLALADLIHRCEGSTPREQTQHALDQIKAAQYLRAAATRTVKAIHDE